MRPPKMWLRLTPLESGAYTMLQLRGPVPTAPQSHQWLRLLAMLSHWNGFPVHVALSAADPGWCEIWTHALRDVPERHLELHFRHSPRR
jgi:hypothetical protein